ncbi:MAG: gliding motility-associated C-terminal domain-containing protein [Janthinobacterium lividum]
MQLLFSSVGRRPGLTWVWAFLLLGLAWLQPQAAQASHLRAGDIQAKVDTITGNPNHIYFIMTIYRDNSPGTILMPDVEIYFGDGTRQDMVPKASSVIDGASNTEIIRYKFDHVYPGPGNYICSYIGENRNKDIVNMTASDNQSFYIATSITVNPAYGLNHSPVLRAPAVDRAAVGQVWLHNPAGYDADGDSLAYRLRTCQQVNGGISAANSNANTPQPIVCNGYVYPNDQSISPAAKQVTFAGTPAQGIPAGKAGSDAIIVQDAYNGQITWNAPSRAGNYNIAFVVEEWRRTAFGRILIGTVIRDMQIIVSATQNTPPILITPPDLCVIANTPVSFNVSATDGSSTNNPASNVTLFAYSGILPPATFVQNNVGTTVTGTFKWTPDCSKVADQPYVVVFKAQDNPTSGNPILIDEKPVRIKVIGPAPLNLQVTPASLPSTGLAGVLSWTKYTCTNASQILIFRKENPSSWSPTTCETGIPAYAGYTQIASVGVGATSYTDDNAGKGLTRGKTYCYRIYAVFPLPAGGASIASAEACVTFNGRAARLKNVDVDVTSSTNGQITVKWTKPVAPTGSAYLAPGYRLSRGEGSAPATFIPIATFTGLNDSSYVDTNSNLNTLDKQYTYLLTFTYQDNSTGTTLNKEEPATPASSVRLRLTPDGLAKSMTVSWSYNVPWDNTKQPTLVYRNDGNNGTVYTQVGTATSGATSGTYTDTDPTLVLGKTYCYYVQTNGQYADLKPAFFTNLLNKSQRACAKLVPQPCTPVLSIRPINCDSLEAIGTIVTAAQRYVNKLSWTPGTTPAGCVVAADYYRILRATTSAGPFVAIDSTAQLSYADRNLTQADYCYVVQAVSADKVRSALSNVACQDMCMFFDLPNIFTPNADHFNDTFRPKAASGVLKTHIQIFNRWGRKVYESDQYPYIDWSGGGAAGESGTSGMVTSGLYYFLAEVTFSNNAQTTRTFKGWVEVVR